MAANVPYLKGVRTRFPNSLNQEVLHGLTLLQSNMEQIDVEQCSKEINKCVEKIQTYCDKLENQTDRLADAIGEKEVELTQLLIEENKNVCDSAMECIINLHEFKAGLTKPRIKEGLKLEAQEKARFEHFVEQQEKMQNMFMQQIQQQQDLIEKHILKEKDHSSTIKLPKLDMASFAGDKLRWIEFWDSFESSVNKNTKLSVIEKFSCLRSKLTGEARNAISGLSLSNENYQIAIDILKERFGNEQEVIDLHYNRMISLRPATSNTSSLRALLDNVERHLRSLEVLKQNVNQDVFVSIIRGKLPEDVLLQLEISNGAKNKWTTSVLRARLHEYVVAREKAEKKTESRFNNNNRSYLQRPQDRTKSNGTPGSKVKANSWNHTSITTGSAEALVANNKQNPASRHYDQGRYCAKRHWSDECPQYQTINERKQQLKDICFRCLKVGHVSKECKQNKMCVHYGEFNIHHRSLCPKKFRSKISNVHLSEERSDWRNSAKSRKCTSVVG